MNPSVLIRLCKPDDENDLFSMLEREGDEWQDYWKGENRAKYQKALTASITYLLYAKDELCGFARCRDDDGYGIYVCDLLVDKNKRGNEYGRLLLEKIYRDFPDVTVYVMSDADPYYEKLGYAVEGAIFVVKPSVCSQHIGINK